MSHINEMPRIHHREKQVNTAKLDLSQALLDITTKHDLTDAETLRIVAQVAYEHVGGLAKHWIRQERHGDSDKPGGWE